MGLWLGAEPLPVHPGGQPLPVFGTHDKPIIPGLWPLKMPPVQAALTEPHPRAIPDQKFESGASPVGKPISGTITWGSVQLGLHLL